MRFVSYHKSLFMTIGITILVLIFLSSCSETIPSQPSDVTIYSHDIMQNIKGEGSLKYGAILKKIRLDALKGEYEPFSFSIYCRETCNNLSIDVSNLKKADYNTDGVINHNHIEIHRLKMGRGNRFVHDWILESFQDNTILKGDLSYFWVTVHVPQNAESGMYQGLLTISSKDNEAVEVPLELNVLPQKLEDPEGVQFAMLYTVSPFGQHYKPDKYEQLAPGVLEFYKELRAHGMTAISPQNSDWPYRKGFVDGLRAEVTMARKAGFSSPVLWYMSSLINGAKGGKRYSHYDGKCDNWNETRDLANLRDIVMSVKEIGKKERWPEIVFIPVDEPGTMTENRKLLNRRLDILEKTMKLIHNMGARGATTVSELVDERHNKYPFAHKKDELRRKWDRVRPYSSIRIYNYEYPQGQTNLYYEKADSVQRKHEIWFYYNKAILSNNRYKARIFYGLWGWKVGANGLTSWTYPGKRTVQWEIVREGIDDFKYLNLIQKLIEKRHVADHKRKAAEKFLKEVYESVKLNKNGYIKNWAAWEDFDFENFRRHAGRIILELSQN